MPTSKRARVLMLLGWYYPDSVGGTENYVRMLAKDLRSLGWDAVILAPAHDGSEGSYEHEGISVCRYPVTLTPGLLEIRGETCSGDLTMKGWMPPHPTCFVKRDIYDKLGNFNTDIRITADYDLILRFMVKGGITAFYVPEVLVKMRLGGDSNRSLKNIALKMKEDLSIMRSNGLTNPTIALLYKNLSKVG